MGDRNFILALLTNLVWMVSVYLVFVWNTRMTLQFETLIAKWESQNNIAIILKRLAHCIEYIFQIVRHFPFLKNITNIFLINQNKACEHLRDIYFYIEFITVASLMRWVMNWTNNSIVNLSSQQSIAFVSIMVFCECCEFFIWCISSCNSNRTDCAEMIVLIKLLWANCTRTCIIFSQCTSTVLYFCLTLRKCIFSLLRDQNMK